MPEKIHYDEWLKELSALTAKSDGGMTAEELSEAWGLSNRTTLLRLRLAYKQGCVRGGRRTITRMDGKPIPDPVSNVAAPRDASQRRRGK